MPKGTGRTVVISTNGGQCYEKITSSIDYDDDNSVSMRAFFYILAGATFMVENYS